MATASPVFGQGKDVIITITPQTLAADGTLADHAVGGFSMSGRVEDHDEEGALSSENLSPAHFFASNPIPFEQGASLRITEYVLARTMVSGSNKTLQYGNVIRFCARTSFYWKVVVTLYDRQGTPAAVETATYYVVLTSLPTKRMVKGKLSDSITCSTIIIYDTATGLAIANPAFS